MNDEQPNIVLVTVDSLRADHCGFMGYEKETTPYLDKLAEDGVVFENAVAPAPFTAQSIPAILTGSHPLNCSGNTSIGESTRTHIDKHESIAQNLSKRGYSTAGFSPNPHASRQFGLDQGFDTFHDFIGDDQISKSIKTIASQLRKGDFVEAFRLGANMLGLNIPGFGNQSIPVRAYYDQMISWASNATKPFFLWMFPLEVHSPYRPERQFRDALFIKMLYLNLIRSAIVNRDPSVEETEQLLSLYDGAIQSVDATIEMLHKDLAEFDPILIVTGDHGEAFGEHDNFGHKDDLYSENVKIPLLVSGTDESGRIAEPISLKKLSAMISQMAIGGSVDWQMFTEPMVPTRVQEQMLSVRSPETTYIISGNSSVTYNQIADTNEVPIERPPDNDMIKKAGQVTFHQEERREIVRATCTLTQEETSL